MILPDGREDIVKNINTLPNGSVSAASEKDIVIGNSKPFAVMDEMKAELIVSTNMKVKSESYVHLYVSVITLQQFPCFLPSAFDFGNNTKEKLCKVSNYLSAWNIAYNRGAEASSL